MKLPECPEPIGLKEKAKLLHKEHPDMDIDSLYIWVGQNLASYLWKTCGWGRILKEEGISWQKFEKIISLKNFKWWVRGERTWDEQISNIMTQIKRFQKF